MGALQKVIAQILARLRDVTPSQKVALVLGGALVAVSLIWLVQWTAQPEMVPLLEQDLTPEELMSVQAGVEAIGEQAEVRGSRVYVRSGANRAAILAHLQQQQQLPSNTSVGFAALVKESDPWISQAENDRRWTYALQEEIQSVLRQFNGVRDAHVFLNISSPNRSFTKNPPPKSASVTLIMKQADGVPRALALAAARLVSGAVAGLRVQDVQVVDASGSPALDWTTEDDATNVLNRHLIKEEQRYTTKIRQILADPKAMVGVQVELDSTTRHAEREEVLKGQTMVEETQRESTTRIRTSQQPGVQPNTGLAAGAGGADESHETERSKSENRPGLSRTSTATPPGDVTQVTAAISLSYSYLKGVFRQGSPDVEVPTEAQITEVFQRELKRLAPQVAKLVKPQTEDNVAISWYYDSALEPVGGGPAGTVDNAIDLVKSYGPQSGLALLALVSLAMMLRLARKADEADSFGMELGLPAEAIEAAKQAATDVGTVIVQRRTGGGRKGGQVIGADGQVIDAEEAATLPQAAATEGMLVAQEVDAATIQARKMLDQVREMVDENPSEVAALIEQWIQKSDQYHEAGG